MTIAATTVIAKVEAGVTKVVNATMDGVVTGVDLHNDVLLVPMDRHVNTVALLPAPRVLVDVRVLPVTKATIVKTTSTTAPMSRAVATATASTETTRSHATVSQDLVATVVKWI